jgi:hypothetical protein
VFPQSLYLHADNSSVNFPNNNDMGCIVRKCLLRVALIWGYISGSNSPEAPHFWTRMPNFQPNIHTKNFRTVWDKQKISTHRLYKTGVKESNGDVISAARRRLAAKITSSASLKVWKLRITCKRLKIDKNVTVYLIVGLSINWWHQIYSEAPHIGQNHFRFHFKSEG